MYSAHPASHTQCSPSLSHTVLTWPLTHSAHPASHTQCSPSLSHTVLTWPLTHSAHLAPHIQCSPGLSHTVLTRPLTHSAHPTSHTQCSPGLSFSHEQHRIQSRRLSKWGQLHLANTTLLWTGIHWWGCTGGQGAWCSPSYLWWARDRAGGYPRDSTSSLTVNGQHNIGCNGGWRRHCVDSAVWRNRRGEGNSRLMLAGSVRRSQGGVTTTCCWSLETTCLPYSHSHSKTSFNFSKQAFRNGLIAW